MAALSIIRSRYSAFAPVITGLAAAALSLLITRHGVLATEDSWAYWEGAVSLLETGHYAYADGEAIMFWPPLFSLYLAAFQWFFGQTGSALAVAMSTLAGITATLWHLAVRQMFSDEDTKNDRLGFYVSMAFTITYVPLSTYVLIAHVLLLPFTGAAYIFTVGFIRPENRHRWVYLLCLSLSIAACLLSHNLAVCFVPAWLVILWLYSHVRTGWQKILTCLAFAGVAILPWMGTRIFLGQSGSHHAGWGDAGIC